MWRRTLQGAALVATVGVVALMRVPTLVSTRPRDFDEGVYGVSVLAIRAGEAPFRDVFSSQGPLFLPLLWAFDLLGLWGFRAMRIGMIAAAVAITLGAFVVVRRVGTRWTAIVASAVIGTSATVLMAAGPVQSDGFALAFTVWAIAAAMTDRLGRWQPVVVGILMGAAVAVKSVFALPAGLAVAYLFVADRAWRDFAVATGTGLLVVAATVLPWGFADVWDQAVRFQLDAPRDRDPLRNISRSAGILWGREPIVLSFLAAATVGAVLSRFWPKPREGTRAHRTAVLVWLAASVLLITLGVQVSGGFMRFLAFVVVPLVTAACMLRPPAVLAIVLGAALIPVHLSSNDDILWRRDQNAIHRELVARLEALPEGALVVSDRPGLVWIAERHPPGPLVDTSWARIRSGDLTATDVLDAAADPDVCAVVFYSGRFDFLDPDLAARLDGYELQEDWGDGRRLFTRGRCE